MANTTYTVYNAVDGKFDTYHWDPTNFTSASVRDAVQGNTGTTVGKKDTNRDTDRTTAENRAST